MFSDNDMDSESLKISEVIAGQEFIFEWDRSYLVKVYPEDESFVKEFELGSRSYNELFDLIDQCDSDPSLLVK